MTAQLRNRLGIGLVVAGPVVLGHVLWAWSTTARVLASDGATPLNVHWMWLTFSPSPVSGLLLVVALTAATGSLATTGLVFAGRAGHRTLEQHWGWWYLLRPCAAASIGVLFYAVLFAGLLGSGTPQGKDLALAGAVGGLAGLFTDRVLALMRSALGASAFNVSASHPREAATTGGTGAVESDVSAT
jgi:hypothetical protein